MTGGQGPLISPTEPIDYEAMVAAFNQALIHTLRKHNVAQRFLDLWVPDVDPVRGIVSMVDSARLGGLAEITIRLCSTTVPADRLPELEASLERSCRITLDRHAGHILLRATDMRQNGLAEAAPSASGIRRAYWHPDAAQAMPAAPMPAQAWDNTELSEFADVHPHFRRRLRSIAQNIEHEGGPSFPVSGTLVIVTGHDGPVTLTLAVDPEAHLVRAARHQGAAQPAMRAVLDLFCKTAENLPIQEVADHAALKVLDTLVDDDESPPVRGVLLPANAGAPFVLAGQLARQAYNAYRNRTGAKDTTNFYYEPPNPEWLTLSADHRLEKASFVLRAFLQSENLYPDDMAILRIEKNKYSFPVRVIVSLSERTPVSDKPSLMRRLEHRLRRDVEATIDLVADRAKDTSPLRRLS